MDEIMKQNVKILEEMSNERFGKDYYRLELVKAKAELSTKTARIVDLEQKVLDSKLLAVECLQDKQQKIDDLQLIIENISEENEHLSKTIKKLNGLKIK